MRALPSAGKTYSVYECSKILGVTPACVRRWILRGDLPAHKIKKHWAITQTNLRTCQAEHPLEKT